VIKFQGVGIHSGQPCSVELTPLPVGSGIQFNQGGIIIPALSCYCVPQSRATVLAHHGQVIGTPEHLLSAMAGLGITDVAIHMNGPELPILDGSAAPFAEALQSWPRNRNPPLAIVTPLHYQADDTELSIYPSPISRWTVMIEYPDSVVGQQWIDWVASPDSYIHEIAPARTYGFDHELEALTAQGLAKGASLQNAILITASGYAGPLRFHNELVRHKLLDLMGDLALIGVAVKGHVVAKCPGHRHNTAFATLIRDALQ